MAAITPSTISSRTMNIRCAFGRKRDSKTRPRYSCVIPRSRPWPTASTTVTPTCPVSSSTASMASSTRSRSTIASTLITTYRAKLARAKLARSRHDRVRPRRLPSKCPPRGGWGIGTGPPRHAARARACRATRRRGSRWRAPAPPALTVEVQGELGRVRAEPHDVDLVRALVLDPGADQLLGEDAACKQELVVGLERVQGLAERPGNLCHVAVRLLE